jgi:hypothetical protein
MPQVSIESDCLLLVLDSDESQRWRALDWDFRGAYLACIREHGLKMGIDQFVIRDASGHLDSGYTGVSITHNTVAQLQTLLAGADLALMPETPEVV